MKICTVCKIEKEETAFNWKNKANNKRQSSCRQCTKEQVDGTRKNADGTIKTKYSYPLQVKQRKYIIRQWFNEKKSKLSCMLCGFSHPAVLDFHHRDPLSKTLEISKMVDHGFAYDKIEQEIAKCDVLCSNCHRIKHWNERAGIV